MKQIRMLKTMSGPSGTRYPGDPPFVTSDEEADALVAAGAAEVIAVISKQVEAEVLTPDIETTAVESAPEKAVQPKARRRKPAAKQ